MPTQTSNRECFEGEIAYHSNQYVDFQPTGVHTGPVGRVFAVSILMRKLLAEPWHRCAEKMLREVQWYGGLPLYALLDL